MLKYTLLTIKGNADRTNTAAIISLLLSLDDKSTLDTLDSSSSLPLHLLNAKAAYIDENATEARKNVLKCIKIYLDSRPKEKEGFLVGIRSCPEYVGDVAVIHPGVQGMLNMKITSR